MSKKGENIYKRKDGRWEARYIKGCSTEAEVEAFLQNLQKLLPPLETDIPNGGSLVFTS